MERIRIVSELIGETFGRFNPESKTWKSEAVQQVYELEAWELMEKLSQKGYYIVRAPVSIVKQINDKLDEEDRDAERKLIEERST